MSWQAARRVAGVDEVFVATDDTRNASRAEGFGASVVMTDEACENGTARCADAVTRAGLDYARHPVGTLEQLEGLEQLRFLEAGQRVRCVEVNARGQVFWELNYPHDRARIEAALISNQRGGATVP